MLSESQLWLNAAHPNHDTASAANYQHLEISSVVVLPAELMQHVQARKYDH
jgi:hypothetical protein